MGWKIRPYEGKDFGELHRLDRECFPPGIAYSEWTLDYFLGLETAECLVAEEAGRIVGFILGERKGAMGHVITLDVREPHRRKGVGTGLLGELERRLRAEGVRGMVIETSVENASGIAFWERHGYRAEAVLKRYYLGKVDGLEMRKRLGTEEEE